MCAVFHSDETSSRCSQEPPCCFFERSQRLRHQLCCSSDLAFCWDDQKTFLLKHQTSASAFLIGITQWNVDSFFKGILLPQQLIYNGIGTSFIRKEYCKTLIWNTLEKHEQLLFLFPLFARKVSGCKQRYKTKTITWLAVTTIVSGLRSGDATPSLTTRYLRVGKPVGFGVVEAHFYSFYAFEV